MNPIDSLLTRPGPPLNIAHRGARSLAPENTLAAARAALDAGADMWEIDVALSADGLPYLIHDDTLTRTTDAAERFPDRSPWHSHDFTLTEIEQLDAGSWFLRDDPFGQIAAGALTLEAQHALVGERAPSLEAALRLTREGGWCVNVELKDLSGTPGDGSIVAQAVALIERLEMVGRVIISSFNHDYLAEVKAINPAIATGVLVQEPIADPIGLLRGLSAQAYHPGSFVIAPDAIPPLRAAGIPVLLWTVNDRATMRYLMQYHPSGLITDFPQRLATLLG